MTPQPAGKTRHAGSLVPRHAALGRRAGAASDGAAHASRHGPGFSLVELLACTASVIVLGAIALGLAADGRQRLTADGAARHVVLALRAARMEAIRQGRSVAVQFLDTAPVEYRLVADGNGNGVRRAEIVAGVDPVLGTARELGRDFPSARFAIGCDCPGIDGGEALSPASPAIQFGEARLAVFTPDGTATSGTVYVTARRAPTYAVRVLGATGRTRVLRFDPANGAWSEP